MRVALLGNVSWSENSAFGYYSLLLNISGSNNTALWNYAWKNLISWNSNIFIWYNVQPNIGTGSSNQLNIGNWIYGNAGNIGIWVAAPGYKLDVNWTWSFAGIRVASWAVNNYILTSDATGNARWAAPASSGWWLTINAGTNSWINFVGTTDAKDLVFKANNSELLRITSGGNLAGIGYANTLAESWVR